MRRDANRQADEMMAAVQEQVVAFRQKVRQDVLQELEKARKQLRKQAENLSLEITTKVLGRRV
jgi:F0F1-type ATP synthase membrane subunit b/b'